MQFSLIALLGLSSAVAFAAPTAEAEAAALPYDSAPLEIRNGGQWACCPQGSKKGCSSCQPHQKCPSNKPDQYKSCSGIGQIGLVNLLLCDVLNDNTVNVPITIDLLSG